MLPTHKRRQIPRTIFSYICDIARPSHLLYGAEGFYEISELGADAITIDATPSIAVGTMEFTDTPRRPISFSKTSTKNWGATLLPSYSA
jgi:hypothetical protein